MTKYELLHLALETAMRDEMTFAPDQFKGWTKELKDKAQDIYIKAQRQKREILAIMVGEISYDDLEDE